MFARCAVIVLAVVILSPASAFCDAHLSCQPNADTTCPPGASISITASGTPPPGGSIGNYKIWVNGVSNPGPSYTLVTDPTKDPYEYIYWSTATAYLQGGGTQELDSRTVGVGDGRPGDVIAISTVGTLQSVKYDNDYPLYKRGVTNGDGSHGRDITKPQWTGGEYSEPVCILRGNMLNVTFHTIGNGTNNNVTLRYYATESLAHTASAWPFSFGPVYYTAGTDGGFTTPAFPSYIYRHSMTLRFRFVAVFSADGVERQLQDTAVSTYVYNVFSDPTTTFPPYHVADVETNPMQNKAWVEILDNAITHSTTSLSNDTVVDTFTALQQLTTDLYVWPGRPDGPGSSLYSPTRPMYYYYNGDGIEVRYDLWGMSLNTNGDCQDFSAYLECQARSLGISGVTKINLGPSNGTRKFVTNPVIFCGKSPPAATTIFNFHQMMYMSGIFDWAVAFDTPDIYGHPWTLATGFSQSQEYSALVNHPVVPSLPPVWSATFALGGADPMYGGLPTFLASYPRPW